MSTDKMPTRQIVVQRWSATTFKPFEEVVWQLDAALGHPEMSTFYKDLTSAKAYSEVEKIVNDAIGPSGFLEFARLDLGEVLRKERGPGAPRSLRLIVGNPLIMKQMLEHVPDSGSYAPVTILVDERQDTVHLSYDTMASLLSPYGNPEAMKVAQELDSKVEALLAAAMG